MHPLLPYSVSPEPIKLSSGESVQIGKCYHQFKVWRGSPIADTYGGKAVLELDGEPVFAEIAILRLLQKAGWDGVWIDTYRRRFRQSLPPRSCVLPARAQDFLDKANAGRKWPPGSWDVFAWKNAEFLFVESKRKGKDAIRQSQIVWLGSALNSGIPLDWFVIFEWDQEGPSS